MIVDDAPQGSLLVASRTCQARSTDSDSREASVYLRLHFGIIHNRWEEKQSARKGEADRPFYSPFCTFRTPAFKSYSVRLLTCSFKLLKSIGTAERVREQVGLKRMSWEAK